MSERIILRTGEALVEGTTIISVPSRRSSSVSSMARGPALANLIGDQVKGTPGSSPFSTATCRFDRRR